MSWVEMKKFPDCDPHKGVPAPMYFVYTSIVTRAMREKYLF